MKSKVLIDYHKYKSRPKHFQQNTCLQEFALLHYIETIIKYLSFKIPISVSKVMNDDKSNTYLLMSTNIRTNWLTSRPLSEIGDVSSKLDRPLALPTSIHRIEGPAQTEKTLRSVIFTNTTFETMKYIIIIDNLSCHFLQD